MLLFAALIPLLPVVPAQGASEPAVETAAVNAYWESPAALRASLLHGEIPAYALADDNERRVDPWFSFDKVQHVTFSFLFTVGWQYGLENKLDWSRNDALPVSIGTTLLIGLGKELYDWQLGPRRFFSYRDMIANSVGVGLATVFIVL